MAYQKKQVNAPEAAWVQGELRLAGLDSRIMQLLSAIEQSGSINQAAKKMALSYKGAWQIIERANLTAPKPLVVTATGGSRGGGTYLSETGKALVNLFHTLQQQHQQFLQQLNAEVSQNPELVMILQRLAVQTSACNQLFGTIERIVVGAVNAEVTVKLNQGEQIIASISLETLYALGLKYGMAAVLLLNSADILLALDVDVSHYSASNRFAATILRLQADDAVNVKVTVLLAGGAMLTAVVTAQSVDALALTTGMAVWVLFKSNVPILGVH